MGTYVSKWSISDDSAWFKVGDHSYRHYCGAEVEKHERLWRAKTESGVLLPGYETALDAVTSLRRRDYNSFWTFGQLSIESHVFGFREYGNTQHKVRPIYRPDQDEIFIFHLPDGGEFPEFFKSILNRHFFGRSNCVRCSSPMTGLQTLRVHYFDGKLIDRRAYLACECGYSVWRMASISYSAAIKILEQNAASWRRQQKLKAAGGKHGRREIREILALQQGRCIYCDAAFSDKNVPSEDHLLPVSEGGSDSAHNIVLACRGCNSSRGNIPCRTFCKILSPAQNKRIIMHLGRRLSALESNEAIDRFVMGIAKHDPKHPRYLDISRMRVTARRNAKANRLLPGNARAILERASMQLRPT
jgi:hypothetical protein